MKMEVLYLRLMLWICVYAPHKLVSCQKNNPRKCRIKFDLSVCTSTRYSNSTPPCLNSDACHKYNISSVQLDPYNEHILLDLLRTCCGSCLNYTMVNNFKTVSEISSYSNATSHFVFPVLGSSSADQLYGYYFIPLIETPSMYYITVRHGNAMLHLIMECLSMWPLIINCFFMVIISGFLGWVMETWANREDFPRPFLAGWFEGIWWSFISMTTVGYGDKSPKSVLARLFSVCWILIGITTFSLITAMLSSELTKANSLPPPKISGAKVGALPHRLYDAIVIAKQGGILINVKSNDTLAGVYELVDKMKNNEIDGFTIDRYLLLVLYRHLEDKDPEVVNFLKTRTIRTELSYAGDSLSYGALVKELEDYEFLIDFVKDNKNVINTCNSLLINNFSSQAQEEVMPQSIFLSGQTFWVAFGTLVTTIGVIICFGICYEVFRRKRKLSKHGYIQGQKMATLDRRNIEG